MPPSPVAQLRVSVSPSWPPGPQGQVFGIIEVAMNLSDKMDEYLWSTCHVQGVGVSDMRCYRLTLQSSNPMSL